ncbi:hypothetical protein GWI33_001936 [Rhynchophorus ferrugineus]|uniref:Uncharacterized protein n=1 Tax=Rhynchophorus ferrugineus TaxID=354439 RepID=A0A834IS60_RHYFE|nr:hypothetical protein GWI33_001936 [Rhynchophorus ferrugineus]
MRQRRCRLRWCGRQVSAREFIAPDPPISLVRAWLRLAKNHEMAGRDQDSRRHVEGGAPSPGGRENLALYHRQNSIGSRLYRTRGKKSNKFVATPIVSY